MSNPTYTCRHLLHILHNTPYRNCYSMNSHNNCNLYTISDTLHSPNHTPEYILYIPLLPYMIYTPMDSSHTYCLHSCMFLINTLLNIRALPLHCILHNHPNIAHNIHPQPWHNLYDKNHKFHQRCIYYIQVHKICMSDLLHNILVNKLYKYLFELDIKYIDLIYI